VQLVVVLEGQAVLRLVGDLMGLILEGRTPNLVWYLRFDVRRDPSHFDKFIIIQFWNPAGRASII